MHAEVVEDKPGKCPICGMPLAPVRLALVWSCSVHPGITREDSGRCSKCGRDLVQVTKAVTFSCPVHPKVDVPDPGRCPICGRTLVAKYSIRPHGDHNPKHGGQFFMASNNWHLEVTHPSAATFRLYIYDEYSSSFSPPGLMARITESVDATGKRHEVSVPFERTMRGYYQARLPDAAIPATIAARVRFEPNDKDYRFDFIFPDYSREPLARPVR
ncbi:MAG TPA: heavy metal-binding domain-containing protein [Vicinamibacterales bacterium]